MHFTSSTVLCGAFVTLLVAPGALAAPVEILSSNNPGFIAPGVLSQDAGNSLPSRLGGQASDNLINQGTSRARPFSPAGSFRGQWNGNSPRQRTVGSLSATSQPSPEQIGFGSQVPGSRSRSIQRQNHRKPRHSSADFQSPESNAMSPQPSYQYSLSRPLIQTNHPKTSRLVNENRTLRAKYNALRKKLQTIRNRQRKQRARRIRNRKLQQAKKAKALRKQRQQKAALSAQAQSSRDYMLHHQALQQSSQQGILRQAGASVPVVQRRCAGPQACSSAAAFPEVDMYIRNVISGI